MKLEMKTQMLWMLYGFRITSPESQNKREDVCTICAESLGVNHKRTQTHPVPVTRRRQDEGRKTTSLRTTVVPGAGKRVSALPVSTGLLLHWRSGGAKGGVFLRSGLSCWFPLPGSGQRKLNHPPCSHTAKEGCRGVGLPIAQKSQPQNFDCSRRAGPQMEEWIMSPVGRCRSITLVAITWLILRVH
jgi:hypothetical protein